MIQGMIPLFFTGAGVLATGVAVYVAVERQDLFDKEPVAKPEPIIQLMQPEPETNAPEIMIEAEEPVLPRFDVLRIEKNGSLVAAGNGPADSKIEILNLEGPIAETNSGPSGDFAIVLENPLAPGLHELFIRATPKEGEPVLSAEVALIQIPDDNSGEIYVLLTEKDKPSRLLQRPEPKEVAKVELEPTPEPDPVAPVLIEAAEVEGSRIYIAGTGEPGSLINLYLDEELLGSAAVAENGSFLFEGTREVAEGRYAVRADMVDVDSGKVLARAEVSLVHEPQVVAEAEPEPEPTEEVKPEIRTGTSVIIRRGDSLWKVAYRNYGAGVRYTTIFEANTDQIRDPDLIYPGQVLKVPDQPDSEEVSNSG